MDAADVAQVDMEALDALRVIKPYHLDPGVAGKCEECGEKKARLIATDFGRICASCRTDLRAA